MKRFLGLVLLVFLAMGICTAQVPNLIGNWTGFENEYAATYGSYKSIDEFQIHTQNYENAFCILQS